MAKIQLSESLHTVGRRLTRQRQLVLDVLQQSTGHLDAESIYTRAKARDPHISLATVYRTLAVLKEMGLVNDNSLGESHAHFEAAPPAPHYHFTCLGCGQVIELPAALVVQAVHSLSQKEKLQITDIQLLLRGYCTKCQKGKRG